MQEIKTNTTLIGPYSSKLRPQEKNEIWPAHHLASAERGHHHIWNEPLQVRLAVLSSGKGNSPALAGHAELHHLPHLSNAGALT